MKATKDHIGLDTAKLLKGCGVDSQYIFVDINSYPRSRNYKNGVYTHTDPQIFSIMKVNKNHTIMCEKHPAYTWQEILWEYPEEFFGDGDKHGLWTHQRIIFMKLTDKKYEEADLYFREHCILIKQV